MVQFLQLEFRDHFRRTERLQKPEKQKVCYEVVSPRNIRNCTRKDPPTRLQRHELNEDNKRNINLEQGKTRRI